MRAFGLILTAAFFLSGCGGERTNLGGPIAVKLNQPKKLRIAVIPKGTTHEFWKSVHAGAKQAAEEIGDVEIVFQGPANEADIEGQIGKARAMS